MASDGASAARISGADVDTATTATPSSTRSTVGGARGCRRARREGGHGSRSLAHPLLLHDPCENLGDVDADLDAADLDGADLDGEAMTDPGAGRVAGEVMYNPFEDGFSDDPYAQYAAIRADGRVHHNPLGLRVLSALRGLLRAAAAGRDERRRAQRHQRRRPARARGPRRARRPSAAARSSSLDPPDHTRLRRLVSSAFTVRRIERLRDRARVLVAELLDDIAGGTAPGEPVDLIARFAFPLPFVVISELLGMPDGDRDQLRAWSHEMTRSLEPFNDDAHPPPHHRRRRPDVRPRRRRHRVEAAQPGRRPAERHDRRRGGRRPPDPRRAARPGACCCTWPATRRP